MLSLIRKPYVFIALIVLGAFLIGGAYFYISRNVAFEDDYAAYTALAEEHTQAAYLPAANNNPLRQELNQTLGQVLAGEMSNSERLALAERGLELLDELEQQIDAIGERGIAVDEAITALEEDGGLLALGGTAELLTLARERSAIIADIRGLSYRANFHTAEIFNRVVDDGGALTAAHVGILNDQVPKVEEQFNKRSNLYDELQTTSQKIDTAFAKMAGK